MSRLEPLVTPAWPSLHPRSDRFQVHLDGKPQDVFPTASAHVVVAVGSGMQELRIRCAAPVLQASVHPLRAGLTAVISGDTVSVSVPMPFNGCVQIDGLPRLYLFSSPPETERPDPSDPRVHYFRGGQTYEVDCLELGDGETLYLEYGAILRGCVRSYGRQDITIRGPGIIDGGRYTKSGDRSFAHLVRYEGCRHIRVQDVTMLRPCTWTHVLFGCDDARIDNVHQIGEGNGNDGIDVMSSRDVIIRGGFIHSGDDCLVVKAQCEASARQRLDGRDRRLVVHGRSERIHASGCVLLNDGGGNGLEIGHELRCDRVGDITFTDIDLLASHGHGAAFSIHNCDRAVVEHIRFDDIRVEHHYDKLFSLRITKSRFHFDAEYGSIRDVEFRNLDIVESPYNPGYTCSVIGGHDAEHRISDLRFVNVRLGGRLLTSFDDFDAYHKHVDGVRFSAG